VKVFERWQRDGTPFSDIDDDIVNASLEAEWAAHPHRRAAELALEAARDVNATIEALPDFIVQTLIEDGNDFLLNRHRHRAEHIEQIEAALM
jgi:hypothetical protein